VKVEGNQSRRQPRLAGRVTRSLRGILGAMGLILVLGLGSAHAQEASKSNAPTRALGDAIKDLNEGRLSNLRSQVKRLGEDLETTQGALVAVVNTQSVIRGRLEAAAAEVTSTSATLEAATDEALRSLYKEQLKTARAAQSAAKDALSQASKTEKELSERLESLRRKLESSREGLESQANWLESRFRAELPQEELRAFLRPLTLRELEVETKAWVRLVHQKVAAISANELWLATNKGDPERSTQELDERTQSLVLLQDDRAKLVDRARLVLAELRLKGAEESSLSEEEAYLKAVSGIQIDTTDSRAVAVGLWNWLKAEEGGIRWGKNFVAFFLILTVTFVLSRALGWFAARAARIGSHSDLLEETVGGLVRKGVFLVGFVIALSALEVNTTPLMAALGGAALVIGLALQGTLANFAAGLLIVAYRPFDRGNVVEAGGVLGKVRKMSMLTTTIVTPDNKKVVVPNGAIWNGTITNLTGMPTRRVDLVVGVGYSCDLNQVQETLEQLLSDNSQVLADPAPVIEVNELADNSVNFVVRPWCRTDDYWDVYWGVTRAVKLRFDELGIEIPFPQRQLHLPAGLPVASAAAEAAALAPSADEAESPAAEAPADDVASS